MVDQRLDVAPGERSLQRDCFLERLPARVAEEAVREAPAARCLHGCLHRRRDLHVEPCARGKYREAMGAVDEGDGFAEAFRQAGLEKLPSLPGMEPADVDAVDLHAGGDHIGAGRVKVVGVGAAGRQCEAAHGE